MNVLSEKPPSHFTSPFTSHLEPLDCETLATNLHKGNKIETDDTTSDATLKSSLTTRRPLKIPAAAFFFPNI